MDATKRKVLFEARSEAERYYTRVLLSQQPFAQAVASLGINMNTFKTYGSLVSEELHCRVERKKTGDPLCTWGEDIANWVISTWASQEACCSHFNLRPETIERRLYFLLYGTQSQIRKYFRAKLIMCSNDAMHIWQANNGGRVSMVEFVNYVRSYSPNIMQLRKWCGNRVTAFVYLALLSSMPEVQTEMIDILTEAQAPIAKQKAQELEERDYVFAVRAMEAKKTDNYASDVQKARDMAELITSVVKDKEMLYKATGFKSLAAATDFLTKNLFPVDPVLYDRVISVIRGLSLSAKSRAPKVSLSRPELIVALTTQQACGYFELKKELRCKTYSDLFDMLNELMKVNQSAYNKATACLNKSYPKMRVKKVILSAERYTQNDITLEEACKYSKYDKDSFMSEGLSLLSIVVPPLYSTVLSKLQADSERTAEAGSTEVTIVTSQMLSELPVIYSYICVEGYNFEDLIRKYGKVEAVLSELATMNKAPEAVQKRVAFLLYHDYPIKDVNAGLLVVEAILNMDKPFSAACQMAGISKRQFETDCLPLLQHTHPTFYKKYRKYFPV